MAAVPLGFNIDAPRWDQSTFVGRLKHFLNITDPRTVLVPEEELDRAKALVEGCRAGLVPPGSSREQLLYAKKLYDSAFHPDSGEKMNLIGRMSFQVPGGMALTGCMLQFYRTVPAVVFWQWVNQSFNAIVNYTNRNAASPISLRQIGVAYVTATGTALATAVGLNLYTKRAPPLAGPLGPFCGRGCCQLCQYPHDATTGDHQWGRGDRQGQQRARPLQEGGCEGHCTGCGLQDRHGSTGHDYFAHHHGAPGEIPLHAASCSWCQQPVPCSHRDAPLHWLTLSWSCVTASWRSTGTKCRTSILTRDCEQTLPQEPSHPSGPLPPPASRPLSRAQRHGPARSAPQPSTISAASFPWRGRIWLCVHSLQHFGFF
ncbi:sideroflexin-2 isoform X2 [Aquila chrysaetos chrysaetos]|uniref:sideroflexin-2 isoform X2 n=1 Tax=Aquila chrysaetos chrysaetos TaxID=223781 RepID=UPI00117700C4|nr:sideroflexin-2 isoform X2 [Aquila chrysaetos chrysaetos]